jgi:hypothetical protein
MRRIVSREPSWIRAMLYTPNLPLNLAPFGRWTLRDKAAQRRLASFVCAGHGALLRRCKSDGQVCRAEGKEKGKGVVARRGLKEAQSETAGR